MASSIFFRILQNLVIPRFNIGEYNLFFVLGAWLIECFVHFFSKTGNLFSWIVHTLCKNLVYWSGNRVLRWMLIVVNHIGFSMFFLLYFNSFLIVLGRRWPKYYEVFQNRVHVCLIGCSLDSFIDNYYYWIFEKFKNWILPFEKIRFSVVFTTQFLVLFLNSLYEKLSKQYTKSIKVDTFQQEIHSK